MLDYRDASGVRRWETHATKAEAEGSIFPLVKRSHRMLWAAATPFSMVGGKYARNRMPVEDFLLYGTAWLSLAAWAAGEWMRPPGARRHLEPTREAWARHALTIGCLAMISHSLLGFHYRYEWSQARALADAARQTAAVTGREVAAGLLVNYAFIALWTVEVAWWWRAPSSYLGRGAALDWSLRAIFLFMFVNGAVVFATGPVRVVGVVATSAVVWAWWRGAQLSGTS
jgi:hypothetical protein